MTIEEMERITSSIVESNAALLGPGEELSVTQIVSVVPPLSEGQETIVNVVIYCQPLDFSAFARGYVDGVRLVTPATYGAGLSEGDSKTGGRQVFPLMTNQDGIITECKGANFMFAKDGRIKLPDRGNVLPGVSMHTVLELVESLRLGVDEGEYSPYDVYEADEAFVSSTRYCMLPVASLNGYALGGDIPGPLTSRLLDAWRDQVGMDFVQQALDAI
ncbi:MAG: aminotransferase class IV [Chloroflexi bacterium]|nr:aminotransferase class IV [Chloroflexota bacterium]